MNTMGINWGEIYTAILVFLLPPLIAMVVGYIAFAVRSLVKALRDKIWVSLTAEQQKLAQSIAAVGVTMAEQVASRPDVQQEVFDKREEAFAYVDRNLARLGIKLPAKDIYTLIESAVFKEINQKELAPGKVEGVLLQAVPVSGETEPTAAERASVSERVDTYTRPHSLNNFNDGDEFEPQPGEEEYQPRDPIGDEQPLFDGQRGPSGGL